MSARRTARTIDAILAQTEELQELARQPELTRLRAPGVSHWSVGQQLEHLALSDRAILVGLDALLAGKLERAGGGPTWSGRLVLLTRWIPRGKAKAPSQTAPEDAEPTVIEQGLEEARGRFSGMKEHATTLSASRATYKHPALGSLRAAQWLDFTRIHHNHHRRIIAEIQRAAH